MLAVLFAFAAHMAFAGSALARAEAEAAGTEGCPRVVLYFARGSGQELAAATRGLASPGIQLYDDLQKRYEPNVVATMANAYPAVPVTFSFFGLHLLNPFVLASYNRSAGNGVQSAVRNIVDVTLLCPHSRLVLGGYSQGAQVIRTALSEFGEPERQRIAAVTLFGDPYFSASEPNVLSISSFDPKKSGVLRLIRPSGAPPIGAAYSGRVFSWCHEHDFICQGPGKGNTGASHGTYGADAEEAATRIASRLSVEGLAPGLVGDASTLATAYRVHGTCVSGTCGLAEWSGPGASAFRAEGAVYEGQEVRVACQARGQLVLGPSGRSSAIWDRLANGAFVSDLYLNTPAVGRFSSAVPRCKALAVATP
jgi:hypothetical protein